MATKKKTTASGFTAEERAAMKERAEELKSERGGNKKAAEAQALLDKIDEMSEPDKTLAERIHAIILKVAPELSTKTWYGMPAYHRDGKIVCFFQPAEKFGARYATLGFNDHAHLDDGTMWPTSFALTDLTEADAKKVEKLVERAVS